ncbi:MAG: hypothetical protein JST90_18255 [Bacteroidetes bacterium]|nr:hypothetical protein [Bacteroidota bacterium]
MQDYYQFRFQTGKKGMVICGVIAAIFGIVFIFSWSLPELFPIAVIAFLFSIGCEIHFLRKYREVLLYTDRMEISTLFDGTVLTLPFADVKHLGFVKAQTDYSYRQRLSQGAVESVEVSELIILTHGGGRYEFCDDDYDHLPEICAFIQERTGL